ncbi:MAG: hypothetical protein AAF715_28035 [Myxococcota bacterium]
MSKNQVDVFIEPSALFATLGSVLDSGDVVTFNIVGPERGIFVEVEPSEMASKFEEARPSTIYVSAGFGPDKYGAGAHPFLGEQSVDCLQIDVGIHDERRRYASATVLFAAPLGGEGERLLKAMRKALGRECRRGVRRPGTTKRRAVLWHPALAGWKLGAYEPILDDAASK